MLGEEGGDTGRNLGRGKGAVQEGRGRRPPSRSGTGRRRGWRTAG